MICTQCQYSCMCIKVTCWPWMAWKNLLGSKKTIALRQANSVSSTRISRIGCISSSIIRSLITDSSASCIAFLGIRKSLPSSKTSLTGNERRATPRTRCSPAWARSRATWSSNCSSRKHGKLFAQSTRPKSCCFIELQISSSLAIFFVCILCCSESPYPPPGVCCYKGTKQCQQINLVSRYIVL